MPCGIPGILLDIPCGIPGIPCGIPGMLLDIPGMPWGIDPCDNSAPILEDTCWVITAPYMVLAIKYKVNTIRITVNAVGRCPLTAAAALGGGP